MCVCYDCVLIYVQFVSFIFGIIYCPCVLKLILLAIA